MLSFKPCYKWNAFNTVGEGLFGKDTINGF